MQFSSKLTKICVSPKPIAVHLSWDWFAFKVNVIISVSSENLQVALYFIFPSTHLPSHGLSAVRTVWKSCHYKMSIQNWQISKFNFIHSKSTFQMFLIRDIATLNSIWLIYIIYISFKISIAITWQCLLGLVNFLLPLCQC